VGRGILSRLFSRTIIGGVIGAFFVWLSAREWPMDQLAGSIALRDGHLVIGDVNLAALAAGADAGHGWAMELWWTTPYLLLLTLIHILRVIRWKPLLDPIVEIDVWTHNRIGAVGFMAMFLMPLRLGEFVRPYLVKHETGKTRTSAVLATVVVERIADGLTVVAVLFGVLFFLPSADETTSTRLLIGAWGALAVFLGATVLLVGMRWQHDRTVRLVEGTIGLVSKGLASRITGMADAFLGGLRALPSIAAFGWFLLLTCVYWGINGLAVWLMAKAFYLPVDLVGGYAMMACVVVGMMIPNSPGNVGSFWYFLLLPLPLYGVDAANTQAIAFGIMVWWLQLVQQGAFGAWFVLRGQVTWRRVLEATTKDAERLATPPRGNSAGIT
jgi:glycosyltransferase 2 family protein